jgi:hypothetical protein
LGKRFFLFKNKEYHQGQCHVEHITYWPNSLNLRKTAPHAMSQGGYYQNQNQKQYPYYTQNYADADATSRGWPTQPPRQPPEMCADYRRGLCQRGTRCRYVHPDAEWAPGLPRDHAATRPAAGQEVLPAWDAYADVARAQAVAPQQPSQAAPEQPVEPAMPRGPPQGIPSPSPPGLPGAAGPARDAVAVSSVAPPAALDAARIQERLQAGDFANVAAELASSVNLLCRWQANAAWTLTTPLPSATCLTQPPVEPALPPATLLDLQPAALLPGQPAFQPAALAQQDVPALQPVATLTPGPTSTRQPAVDVWAAPPPVTPVSLPALAAPGSCDPWSSAPDPWHAAVASALVAQPDLWQGAPAMPLQPQSQSQSQPLSQSQPPSQPQCPTPPSAQSPLLQLQPPPRQQPSSAHHPSAINLDQRALDRQAYQQQLACDQWDQLQYYSLLAQRLGQEGEHGYYTIARELRVEPAWVRK